MSDTRIRADHVGSVGGDGRRVTWVVAGDDRNLFGRDQGSGVKSAAADDRVGSIHGFSLLNDSKYGYDARDNVLRLSLLRSPEWPDPHADEGHHEFTYSLYPHAGTWKEALTIRQGYEVNVPLLAMTRWRLGSMKIP